VELLGNGFLYSVNYERFIGNWTTIRAGGMILTLTGNTADGDKVDVGVALFPVMLNYLIGSGNHHLEFGGGPLFIYVTAQSDIFEDIHAFGVRATARVGYVYLRPQGGWNFRIAYTPLLTDTISHSAGVAVGYAF
jgi:hypothetical protein